MVPKCDKLPNHHQLKQLKPALTHVWEPMVMRYNCSVQSTPTVRPMSTWKPREKPQQLTTSWQADKGDNSSGRNLQIEVIQNRMTWTRRIREFHRLELNWTRQTVKWDFLTAGHLNCGLQQQVLNKTWRFLIHYNTRQHHRNKSLALYLGHFRPIQGQELNVIAQITSK